MFARKSIKTMYHLLSVLTALILLLAAVGCQPEPTPQPTKTEAPAVKTEAPVAQTEAPAASEAPALEATQAPATVGASDLPAAFADPSKKVRVALVRKVGEGGFMERYLAGAQSMADELGLELVESNARGDDAKMVTAIETAIQQKMDAIIVDHGQTDTVQSVIEQAMAAGIKVLTFDTVINNPAVPEIEQDDLLIGFMLSKALATAYAGQAKVIYVNVGGYAPLDKRDRMWEDFKWRYAGLEEVAKTGAVTDNTAADTQTRVEAVLKENPDAQVAIAMWDEFAKGTVRAILGAGKSDQVKVYSVDITNEDIAMMTDAGSPWVATVATDSYSVGRLAVRTAAAMVGGEPVAKYLQVAPSLITQEFLLSNKITNMDELVAALPALGESPLVWPGWICSLVNK